MKIEYFVEVMNQSLRRVGESVEYMEIHSNMNKMEQHQIMQAILELSERIKMIEAYMESSKQIQLENDGQVINDSAFRL
ncbi:hypothetical protein WAX74_07790 [Psychrobacillus sp. FJAT-51614]|uniref:Uncharacterized protein n=1 Tax=Psychrobacillus mangrovi TaxID=3117745 RepID=A0ABU8F3F5_9BACI